MVNKIDSISAVLSDSPFYGALAVDNTLTTGLTFAYTAGIFVTDNTATTIAASTVILADDTTSVVYRTGSTVADAVQGSEPLEVVRLYIVTTASGNITNIVDTRGHIN